MKTALIASSLSAALIAWPAFGQPVPSSEEHNAHHPQTAQAQTQAPTQPLSQSPAQMPGMMGRGMMGAMPLTAMHGPMMRMMFAVADTNGDSGLSFEEVTAVHKRVFDAADNNKDGKVTLEEMQVFFRQ